MIGTTDLDNKTVPHGSEPFATEDEIDYILEAGNATFGSSNLGREDVLSTFAGLRPIISSGEGLDPSKESRAHVVWEEEGLITVTGGKLTTFRIMAEQALALAAPHLPGDPDFKKRLRYFDPQPMFDSSKNISNQDMAYLSGRYGAETPTLLFTSTKEDMQHIETLPNLWAEVRWAAKCSGIQHLDDLLLRRVRLGMLLPDGASAQMDRIRSIAQPELGWNDSRWEKEEERYRRIYTAYYSPVPTGKE